MYFIPLVFVALFALVLLFVQEALFMRKLRKYSANVSSYQSTLISSHQASDQWCRKLIIGGGGGYSYIRVLHCQILFKSIVFKVCKHEYMNLPPPPIVDLPRHCR